MATPVPSMKTAVSPSCGSACARRSPASCESAMSQMMASAIATAVCAKLMAVMTQLSS